MIRAGSVGGPDAGLDSFRMPLVQDRFRCSNCSRPPWPPDELLWEDAQRHTRHHERRRSGHEMLESLTGRLGPDQSLEVSFLGFGMDEYDELGSVGPYWKFQSS